MYTKIKVSFPDASADGSEQSEEKREALISRKSISRFLSLLMIFTLFVFHFLPLAIAQEVTDEEKRIELERKIQALEDESRILDGQLQQIQGESRSLSAEVKGIDAEVKKKELEIKRLGLAINRAEMGIGQATREIESLTKKIGTSQKALSASLFLLYVYDQDNSLVTLLKNKSLSDYFLTQNNIDKTQASIQNKLKEFKEDRENLRQQKSALEDFRAEQQDLEALREVERRSLSQKKQEKDELLRLTKGKESVFQQLLKSKHKDIASLKTQLFYLEKTGVTAEDAVRAADFAAKKTGVRTAFLLALLEVETGKQFEDGVISAGTRLGTGDWKRDLYDCYVNLGRTTRAETERNAFFSITSRLGLDPDKMPVSKKPGYGCGGAMGPAQFLPSTWLQYEPQVIELTGKKSISPWSVEDSFMAAAVLLADAGADSKTTAGETRAAKVYISGQPTCSRSVCNSYASQITALAKDIDRIL